MYQITYNLPDPKQIQIKLLNMDEQQRELFEIIERNFWVKNILNAKLQLCILNKFPLKNTFNGNPIFKYKSHTKFI